jgi:predicted ATPase
VSGGQFDDEAIRTPDQRLRVFVSSTLDELADEREAVARAVSALRLTPVLFGLGASPHAPRELYRAYLAQSDIFVGLYWQRYGWIGPGMDISGLEDEFELSQRLPRLLYVKEPAAAREPRLTAMLDRIKATGADSYRRFRTTHELSRLVRDDLAVLLSERFVAASPTLGQVTSATTAPPGSSVPLAPSAAAAASTAPESARTPRPLPVETTSLIGRDEAIDDVARLLERPEVRLVTLTGPGGIGKSRLGLAVGEHLRDRVGPGTAYVSLASVLQPELVVPAIARAVGAELAGTESPLEALVEYLGDSPWLLVLDNLEQVISSAPDLGEVLTRCPGVKILATSRTVLGLRAEWEYLVQPLLLPADAATVPVDELVSAPALALFVDRARAVRPDFALTERNASAVVEICRRLEGVPLAIELAAARTRTLDPDSLLARLARSLDAVGTGWVDMPERQRTLRATVEWSVGLLDHDERSLLETTAVFVDGWTIEIAAQVAGLDDDRALDLTDALARHSLVQVDRTGLDARARMLETVRAFVAERLEARPDAAELERRHAESYRALVARADLPLRRAGQSEWLDRLQSEAGNLAAAVRWYLAHDAAPLPHLFRVLFIFWELRDHLGEARPWVDQLLPDADVLPPEARAELLWTAAAIANEVGDPAPAVRARLASALDQVDDPFVTASSRLLLASLSALVADVEGVLREASAALEQLRSQDEPFWTAVAASTTGAAEMVLGRFDDAFRHLSEVRDVGERVDNPGLTAWAVVQLGSLAVAQGRRDDARALLDEGLDRSLAAHSTRSVTLCIVAFAQLALLEGDPERAALLAGAAEGLRRRAALAAWPLLQHGEALLAAQIRDALGPDGHDDMFAAGIQLDQREAVAAIRGTNRSNRAPRGSSRGP